MRSPDAAHRSGPALRPVPEAVSIEFKRCVDNSQPKEVRAQDHKRQLASDQRTREPVHFDFGLGFLSPLRSAGGLLSTPVALHLAGMQSQLRRIFNTPANPPPVVHIRGQERWAFAAAKALSVNGLEQESGCRNGNGCLQLVSPFHFASGSRFRAGLYRDKASHKIKGAWLAPVDSSAAATFVSHFA